MIPPQDEDDIDDDDDEFDDDDDYNDDPDFKSATALKRPSSSSTAIKGPFTYDARKYSALSPCDCHVNAIYQYFHQFLG